MPTCPGCASQTPTEKGLRLHIVQSEKCPIEAGSVEEAADRLAYYRENPEEAPAVQFQRVEAGHEPEDPARTMPNRPDEDSTERCPDCRTTMSEVPEGKVIEGEHDGSDVSITSDGKDWHCGDCAITVLADGSVIR